MSNCIGVGQTVPLGSGGGPSPIQAGRDATEGVAVLRRRRIIWANRMFSSLLRYKQDEMFGLCVRDLYEDEESYRYCGQMMYGGGEARREMTVRWRTRDGDAVTCLVRVHPLGYGGLWAVTLKLLGPPMPAEGHSPAGSAAGLMGRELRQPLSIIRGSAQLLLEESLGRHVGMHLRSVLSACDELRARLDAFLCLFNGGSLIRARLDLSTILVDVLADLEALAFAYSVTVKVDADHLPCEIMGDEGVLRFALLEAAWLVLDMNKDHLLWRLRIHSCFDRRRNEVEVGISGDGDDLPTDPRLEEAERSGDGETLSGWVGLDMVRAVVVQHGGRMVTERNGGGHLTRIIARFPAAE